MVIYNYDHNTHHQLTIIKSLSIKYHFNYRQSSSNIIYEKGYIIVGWLAGDDRIDSYKQFIDGYVPQAFKSSHDYAPIDYNPKTGKIVWHCHASRYSQILD